MNTKIKCLSLLLALVLALGMLPTAAMGETSPVKVVKTSYSTEGKICEIWFAIKNTAEEDVLVDVGTQIAELLLENEGYIMPADQFKVKVHITNQSPNTFVYKNNGMSLKTVAVQSAGLTGFIGYDGYDIELPRVASIAYTHPAMKELFDKTIDSDDADLVLTLFELLSAKGYTGADALSRYFVDYYRKTDSSLNSWADLVEKYRDKLISDFSISGYNGLFDVTKEWLDKAEKTALNDYIYVLGKYSSGDYQIQFKWPDEKLAAFSYDAFYQDLLTVVFGDEEVNNHNGRRDHGVGDYLNTNTEPYISANAYLASIGDHGQLANGAEATFQLTLTLEGQGTGNMYMGYDFDNLFNLTLQFVRATTSVSVTKEWNDVNDHDGLRPASVSVQLYADGKPKGNPVELSKENNWTHTFDSLSRYSEGEEVTYTVAEVEVPGEYTATVTGSAAQGFVITNSHELRPVVTPTQPPVETPTTKPAETPTQAPVVTPTQAPAVTPTQAPAVTPAPASPTAAPTATPPQTGDNANVQLWFALACLSLFGMAVAFSKSRARRKG